MNDVELYEYAEKRYGRFPWNLICYICFSKVDSGFNMPDVNENLFLCACSRLSHRERSALLMRFRDGKTYEEIGKEFAVSRERVRQIIKRSIRKLKNPAMINFYSGKAYEGGRTNEI